MVNRINPRAFAFGCATEVFPPDEIAVLSADGFRLEALAAGRLHPASSADEHFLAVDRDHADPQTLAERAWVRLKGRREFEQEKGYTPPPPHDYGMIEFDADRCWW